MPPQETQILHRHSWNFDRPTPCQVRGVHEVLAHLKDNASNLLSELVQHNAVLFQWDRAYDPDHEAYDPDHIVTIFGEEMPNHEYWGYLSHPPNRPAPRWETWALLIVDGRFHTIGGQPLHVDVIEHHDASFPVIALKLPPTVEEPPAESVHEAWVNSSAPFIAQHVQPTTPGWSFADDIAITPCSPPDDLLRDWSWAWSQTVGPVRFTVGVQRTADELKQWLDGLEMRGYEAVKLSVDSGRPDHHVLLPGRPIGMVGPAYTPDDKGDLRLFERQEGWQGANGVLTVLDGRFQIFRSFHTPNRLQEAAENSILAGVLRGELGEVEWDLFDGDYYSYQAQGPSLRSLREYLDPQCDSQASRDSWNLKSAEIDCRADTSWLEVQRRLAAHFGVHDSDEKLRDSLDAYFAPLRAGQYPRQVQVVLPDNLSVHQGSAEVRPRGTNIVWSFSTAPYGEAPSVSSSSLPP